MDGAIYGIVGAIAVLVVFPLSCRWAIRCPLRIVFWVSLALHLVACVGLVIIAPATEVNSDTAARVRWVQQNPWIWRLNWIVWMATSTSFLTVCVAWRQRLANKLRLTWLVVFLAAVGVLCDLMGETTLIHLTIGPIESEAQFLQTYRRYQWFSPAIANGLYAVAGAILSWYGWGTGILSTSSEKVAAVVWGVAALLTVATVVDWPIGMMVTGIGTMVTFNLWLLLVALNK